MKEDDWDTVLNTNLKSVFNMSKAALRPMMRQKYGRIINITSVAGVTGNAGQTNYSASKAGMIGFTKAMAKEYGNRNITVNAVAPGFVPTDLTNPLPQEIKDQMLKLTPLGRFGSVDDVANTVAFFASDAASYITGQVLRVLEDGKTSLAFADFCPDGRRVLTVSTLHLTVSDTITFGNRTFREPIRAEQVVFDPPARADAAVRWIACILAARQHVEQRQRGLLGAERAVEEHHPRAGRRLNQLVHRGAAHGIEHDTGTLAACDREDLLH